MTTNLDTLLTALYVKIDDMLVKQRRPGHPAELSQSEPACLAVARALPGFHSERRWIRFAGQQLLPLPAGPVRVQQAAAQRAAAGQAGNPRSGGRQ